MRQGGRREEKREREKEGSSPKDIHDLTMATNDEDDEDDTRAGRRWKGKKQHKDDTDEWIFLCFWSVIIHMM